MYTQTLIYWCEITFSKYCGSSIKLHYQNYHIVSLNLVRKIYLNTCRSEKDFGCQYDDLP